MKERCAPDYSMGLMVGIVVSILNPTPALSQPNLSLIGLLAANSACYELDSTWAPQWASLVGYWKFNGSGSIANAASITATVGPAGTAANANGTGMDYTSTRLSQGITFDGTDDSVNLSGLTGTININLGTFAAWVRADLSDTSLRRLFTIQVDSSNSVVAHYIGTDNSLRLITNVAGLSRVNSVGPSDFTVGEWFHYAATWDLANDVTQVYVNGEPAGTRTGLGGTIAGSVTAVRLGTNAAGTGSRWYGALDEPALWAGVALSREEIKKIYDQQSCGKN